MRAIVFDLDGTLLQYRRDYDEILADAVAAHEDDVDDETLAAYDEVFFDRFEAFDPDPVRTAFAAIDVSADPAALATSLLEREIEAARPPAGAETVLERLADDYALGVLTNGVPDWQRRKLAATGLAAYVDAVVASYEVGAHKPDPAPFRAAEERLGADEYAMVGDSDADIDGARAAGWRAHRYDEDGFGDLPDALDW